MYFYLMLVRVAALGVFFVVPGWWKLIPAFFAIFIPYFAVVIANVSPHQQPEGIESPNALPPGPSAAGPAPGTSAPPPDRPVL